MTQREQLIAGLLALGHISAQEHARLRHQAKFPHSAKYDVLAHCEKPGRYFFVGRAGALRFGPTVTQSHRRDGDRNRTMTPTPVFFTSEQAAEQQRAYEQMLVDRYQQGLPMTKWDKRDARRILRQRAAFARDRQVTEG